jgi:hypothetical protein
MTLRWRNLNATYPAGDDARAIVECCRKGGTSERLRSEVIFSKVPDKDQKPPRNQPPFRYRCADCGPTQEDFPR